MSGTLHEDLSTFYCCRRHKSAIKALLYNSQYFYIDEGHVAQQYRELIVAFPLQQWLRERATTSRYKVQWLSCSLSDIGLANKLITSQ